ncbi:MAG: type VII secretion target [Labedaea sp.]
MTGSYDVVTGALRSHAGTLGELAGELRAALEAVGGISLTDNAYGQIGAPAAAAVNALGRIGQDSLTAGVEALESAAGTMRDTAAAYERGDLAGAEQFFGTEDALS